MRPPLGRVAMLTLLAAAALVATLLSGASLAATTTITVRDYAFEPPNATIRVGDAVTWINAGRVPHTTTSDGTEWSSNVLNPNDTFTHVFDTPGTYLYHCGIHPYMKGTITVIGPTPTGTPVRTPTPTTPPTASPTDTASPSPSATPSPGASGAPTASSRPTASPVAVSARTTVGPLAAPAAQNNALVGVMLIAVGVAILAGAVWWRFGPV